MNVMNKNNIILWSLWTLSRIVAECKAEETVSTYLHTNDKISKQILLRNPYAYALFSFNVLSTILVSYLLCLLSSGFIAFEFGNNGWMCKNVGSSSRSSSANLSKSTLCRQCSLEFKKY